MARKRCSICKEVFDTSEFNNNKTKKDGLQTYCRECGKVKHKAYYAKNKSRMKKQILQRKNERMERVKLKVFNFLLEHPCACGESDPRVLEFDHLKEKVAPVSTLISRAWSWNSIRREMEKCQVLCANCHKKKTAEEFNWFTHRFVKEGSYDGSR